jgi:sugar lactone lactonase YvrE
MTGDSGLAPPEKRRDLPSQDPGSPWHAEQGELLWVDIPGHALHRARPSPGGALESVETIALDRPVGAAAPATGGRYVLAAGTGFVYVDV